MNVDEGAGVSGLEMLSGLLTLFVRSRVRHPHPTFDQLPGSAAPSRKRQLALGLIRDNFFEWNICAQTQFNLGNLVSTADYVALIPVYLHQPLSSPSDSHPMMKVFLQVPTIAY